MARRPRPPKEPDPMRNINPTKSGRWEVRIKDPGKDRSYGTFKTIAEAVAARDTAIVKVRAVWAAYEQKRRERVNARANREPGSNAPGLSSDTGEGLNAADDAEVRERIAAVRATKTLEPGEVEPWTVPRMRSTVTAMPYGRRASTVKEGHAEGGMQ